ncbi:MAG: hypothetical protein IJK08_08810 [Prevotella sp.]|nr:hypothetical protein [Prevotella sp.]
MVHIIEEEPPVPVPRLLTSDADCSSVSGTAFSESVAPLIESAAPFTVSLTSV